MTVHLHPISNAPIEGTILPSGTELLEGDVYDSTRGSWEPNPIPGARLRGSAAIWIRPSGDLTTISEEGKQLLSYLAEYNFLLAEDSYHWKVIPSPRWRDDGRMDWEVKNPDCIPELIRRGLILPHPNAVRCYEVTDAGREAVRTVNKEQATEK
jgi:hypothetical protein